MRGEIIAVWPETWRAIWVPMGKHPEYGVELFADLYRELVDEPTPPPEPPPPQELSEDGELIRPEDIAVLEVYNQARVAYERVRATYEEAVNGGPMSRSACRIALKETVATEAKAIEVLETAFEIIFGYEDLAYCNKYYLLVKSFLQKFSIRYDLRYSPNGLFTLHPTLSGIFTGLVQELKNYTDGNPHLQQLMSDFEESLRDLRNDQAPWRIKSCLQRQFNLLEGIGQQCNNVNARTLGDICNQVTSWPHATVREALKKMYGFRSDYPGLGHAGNLNGVLREIEMRDLVAMTALLAGFSPYLRDGIDAEVVYRGG